MCAGVSLLLFVVLIQFIVLFKLLLHNNKPLSTQRLFRQILLFRTFNGISNHVLPHNTQSVFLSLVISSSLSFQVAALNHANQRLSLGRAMAEAISRRSSTAEARVRTRISPCGTWGRKNVTGSGFFPSSSDFPCQCHEH
jgi:hypothetical protein